MDLLVIGGSGFLGLEITRQAQLAGHSVIATFHASPPQSPDADWRMVDIRCRDDVTALARRARPGRASSSRLRRLTERLPGRLR